MQGSSAAKRHRFEAAFGTVDLDSPEVIQSLR